MSDFYNPCPLCGEEGHTGSRCPEAKAPSELSPASCWETVAATFASEIREARRARNLALRAGTEHIKAVQYWESYMAALMRFRTVLKAKMKPSPNEKAHAQPHGGGAKHETKI